MACSAHNACLRRSISQRAMSSHYLQGLNDAQLKAVQHPPDIPLQIHAGPGTGKTKVLTSRVAYLIDHYGLRPDRICAVTFTRMAAREMSARLVTLIGDRRGREVRLGTFHSVAAKELKKHASMVGLQSDFRLYNPADCTTVMSLPVQEHAKVLERCNISLEDGYSMFYELIAKAKGKGLTAEVFREQGISLTAEHFRLEDRKEYMRELHNSAHGIFKQYEMILRRYNALDFDDLIIYYERLLAENSARGEWCEHLLVDEFQDTSVLQYEMIRGMLQRRKALTIVGDPDQSIYGWRAAEVGNLKRMQTDYPDTVQTRLEQNYRSTGKIVKTNVVIIEQERGRVPKTLISTHPVGFQPILYTGVENYDDQADFIASEIRRLYEEAGGLLQWEDFAILVRMNYEKKVIQRALEEEGIPYRKSDKYHFLDRPEVVNLLAFLELISPPESIPNLLRAIPISSKQINMNVIRSVISNPSTFGLSGLELLQRIHDGGIDHSTRQDIGLFLEHMKLLRERTDAGDKPSALIRRTLEITNYAQHLENESSNWESAWKNVQQLLQTAAKFEERSKEQNGRRLLSVFLRVITRLRSVRDHGFDNKVTVTTIHAAKGLEWAVVFIPSVVEKTYPAYFSKDVNEERRLLFVASTRAKILLYFVHPRMASTKAVRDDAAASSGTELTRFLTPLKDDAESYLSSELPSFTEKDLQMISEVLGRPLPDESELVHTVTETITTSTGHRRLEL